MEGDDQINLHDLKVSISVREKIEEIVFSAHGRIYIGGSGGKVRYLEKH